MDRRAFVAGCAAMIGQLVRGSRSQADDMGVKQPSTGRLNAPAPTLGGRQFWADELFFHDWHIQRNVFTGHYRLLDGSNVRRAWGSYDECVAKLDDVKRRQNLPAMQGPAVIVLHGLFRNPSSMRHMASYLRETGGYTVFNVAYPTTRGSVADHAAGLAKVIRGLEGIDELNFVCHSLGNLVVRHYLADHTDDEAGRAPDPRIKRMVMLGPPNQGAQMAEAFADVRLFHMVAGTSASQIARWKELESRLTIPRCQFGILAGGRGGAGGYNPLLNGDNDFVVSVESTRLAGATDFAVLPVVHTLMMDDAKVQEYTLRFLRHGHFISADQRHPLGPNEPG
jgi:pimeloyl-ACP methyl ester carboxylesterase